MAPPKAGGMPPRSGMGARGRVVTDNSLDIDTGRLLALFDLAGPSQADELAHRLVQDLASVSAGMSQALTCADRQMLRTQSHILMAISGTVGAGRLQELAGQLSGLAQAPGALNVAGQIEEVQLQLGRLIQQVRQAHGHWMAVQ